MRWVKHVRPHQSTAQKVLKKMARNEKMAKTINKPVRTKRKSADIPPEKYFVLCNGESLKNIEELARRIEELDEGVYSFHVNAEKNDFANWVQDVFEQPTLAEKLRCAEDRHKSHVALLKHLAFK